MTLLLGLFAAPGWAIEYRSGKQVIVAADAVIDDDLYVLAEEVRIEGEVRGDVVVLGRQVEVAGRVEGNLTAGAERLDLRGEVHDVRAAARWVALDSSARISGDLLLASVQVRTSPGSEVGRDAALAVHEAALAGSVGGDVWAVARGLVIDGPILGSLDAAVGERPVGLTADPGAVPSGLTLGPRAVVAGDLVYEAPAELRRSPRAITRAAIRYTPVGAGISSLLALGWAVARRFLALLLVVGVALLLAPERFASATELALNRSWHALALGVAAVLGWGVAAIAVGVVVGFLGGGLGAIGFSGLSVLTLGTGAITEVGAAVVLALVLGWLAPGLVAVGLAERISPRLVVAIPLAVSAMALIHVIPLVGPVVGIAFGLVGLGAVVATLAGWDPIGEKSVSDENLASESALIGSAGMRS